MFPSPSLGPPLLSASPSPPPFCGIPPALGAGAVVVRLGAEVGAGAVRAGVGVVRAGAVFRWGGLAVVVAGAGVVGVGVVTGGAATGAGARTTKLVASRTAPPDASSTTRR